MALKKGLGEHFKSALKDKKVSAAYVSTNRPIRANRVLTAVVVWFE